MRCTRWFLCYGLVIRTDNRHVSPGDTWYASGRCPITNSMFYAIILVYVHPCCPAIMRIYPWTHPGPAHHTGTEFDTLAHWDLQQAKNEQHWKMHHGSKYIGSGSTRQKKKSAHPPSQGQKVRETNQNGDISGQIKKWHFTKKEWCLLGISIEPRYARGWLHS